MSKSIKDKLRAIDEKIDRLQKEKEDALALQAQVLMCIIRDTQAHKLDFGLVVGACHQTLAALAEATGAEHAELTEAGDRLLKRYEKRVCA